MRADARLTDKGPSHEITPPIRWLCDQAAAALLLPGRQHAMSLRASRSEARQGRATWRPAAGQRVCTRGRFSATYASCCLNGRRRADAGRGPQGDAEARAARFAGTGAGPWRVGAVDAPARDVA